MHLSCALTSIPTAFYYRLGYRRVQEQNGIGCFFKQFLVNDSDVVLLGERILS